MSKENETRTLARETLVERVVHLRIFPPCHLSLRYTFTRLTLYRHCWERRLLPLEVDEPDFTYFSSRLHRALHTLRSRRRRCRVENDKPRPSVVLYIRKGELYQNKLNRSVLSDRHASTVPRIA